MLIRFTDIEVLKDRSIGNNLAMFPDFSFDHTMVLKEVASCRSVDVGEVLMAVQVYLDLAESKNWWNLEVKACEPLQKMVVTGHETQFDPQCIVLPVRSDTELSTDKIESFKKSVRDVLNADSFLLGIVDPNSTVVYYRLSDGLVPPEPPEQLEAKKQRRFLYQKRRKQRTMKFNQIADTMAVKSNTLTRPNSSSQANNPTGTTVQEPHRSTSKQTTSQTTSLLASEEIVDGNNKSQVLPQRSPSKRIKIQNSSLFDSEDGQNEITNQIQVATSSKCVQSTSGKSAVSADVTGLVTGKIMENKNTEPLKDNDKNTTQNITDTHVRSGMSKTIRAITANNSQNIDTSQTANQTANNLSATGASNVDNDSHMTCDHVSSDLDTSMEGNQYTVTESPAWYPNMAPEDFESGEYDNDEFEGEL